MTAATIFLVLAAAGQTGWTPDRYNSQPPAATAPNYDRYSLPPAGANSRVQPPPSIVDRSRSAVTETGTTLRDGLEAGIGAANEQLTQRGSQFIESTRQAGREIQAWTQDFGRQIPPASDNGRPLTGPAATGSGPVTNPFATTSTASNSTIQKSRGGVAPPPWSGASAAGEPDWTTDFTESGAAADRPAPIGSAPARDGGWTSMRSDVAAPPLPVPQLRTTGASDPTLSIASSDRGFNFEVPPVGREQSPPTNDWSTGWGNGPAVQPVTIGRDGLNSTPVADRDLRIAAQQPAAPRTQETRQPNSAAIQPSSNGWPDLFADNNLPELPQRQPANVHNAPPANPVSFSPNNIAANATTAAAAPSAEKSSNTAIGAVSPASRSQLVQGRPTQAAGTEQTWMPMLLVSLSLAGSLGANLFLGFSYLDARQKYASLVRKTANSFRRTAAAA